MNSSSSRRRFDRLGRVTIPVNIRKSYDFNIGDYVEFVTLDEGVLVKKAFNGERDFVTIDGSVYSKQYIEKLIDDDLNNKLLQKKSSGNKCNDRKCDNRKYSKNDFVKSFKNVLEDSDDV